MSRTVFLIAGPSGSGKTTLTQALVQRMPLLTKGITVTTRAPRRGELSGRDYHFVTSTDFAPMERDGELFETDHAFNESYGVPHSVLEVEGDVALIVTVAGALTLKRLLPNTMTLFILQACAGVAAARIADRNSPNESARIASYEAEVAAARHFDSVILNLDFDQALQQLEGVVISRRRSIFIRPKNFIARHHAN